MRQRVALVVAALLGTWSPAPLFGTPVMGNTYTPTEVVTNTTATVARQPVNSRVAQRVTLMVRDSTVRYVVRELARQANLRAIDDGNTALARRIDVNIHDMKVMEAFAVVLRGTGLVARLASDGETVVVSTRTAGEGAQGGVIAGQVTDSATGTGLNGAQVRVQGIAKLATVTADSGNFTLRNVPPGDQVLQVRLFGYRPAIRTVTVVDGERTTVRIAMTPVPTVLSGVVTTAVGVQRKIEVGNDITTINVDSVMQKAPVTSLTDLLETRVPGLTVQHSSGEPGNPSRLRLRGTSSINGNNDPILIVDGIRVYASQSDGRNTNLAPSVQGNVNRVAGAPDLTVRPPNYAAPSPIDQIDPNSIETIEVFKGPSASAMYGSDAANGVIVITTKHGRAGPTHWSLNLGQGVNWLPGSWPTHYFRFGSSARNNQGAGPLCAWNDVSCEVDSVVAFQALNDPRFSVFSHGRDQTAALTVSGGVPSVQYSLTGTTAGTLGNLKLPAVEAQRYQHVYGPVPGWMVRPDNYQTWGMSGQLTVLPAPTARVTLSSSLFTGRQQQGALHSAITELEAQYYDATRLQLSSIPLISADVERATDDQQTATHTLTLAWQPYPWLPLTATGGISTIQRRDQSYIPYGVNSISPGSAIGDTAGSYGLGRGTSEDKTLSVGTTIPSRWVNTAIGANLHEGSTADFSVYTNQLAPGVSSPTTFACVATASVLACDPASQATSAGSTYGWYVAPQLNVNSRFFVSPGFRLDGGSASGTHGGFSGTGLTGFPKIDLSYVMVDPSHARGALTLLRPRFAFGYAGTQPGPTQKLRLFNVAIGSGAGGGELAVVRLNDTVVAPSVFLSTVGNTALRPETSREFEGGVDAELRQGRLAVTWTQYNKTRMNAIISVPVPPSAAGCGSTLTLCNININIGTVRNTGTEVTATARVLESRLVWWMVGGNLSHNSNVLVRLNPGQEMYGGRQNGIVVGYPLFSVWRKPIASFADANHNHIIDPDEIRYGDSAVYVGQQEPKYQMNVNTGVTLFNGRLSANATFAYQNGQTQWNGGSVSSGAIQLLPNAPGTVLATQAALVAAGACGVLVENTCPSVSDIGVIQTVNTFRFNALSINYTLPTSLARQFRVPHAALALQGSNLALHTNYRGKDPNVNAFSVVAGNGDQSADLGQIPEPRTWWLKLTLGN